MADTFREMWGRVMLRCPSLSPLLAQDFVRNAYRKIAERRTWSWLTKPGQAIFPTSMTTGTVTVTHNSNQVVGDAAASAAWTAALVGRQFRISTQTPIYTVTAFDGVSTLTLDQVWGGATTAGSGYEIYGAYFNAPADFLKFVVASDPNYNWRLHINRHTQNEIDMWDAQRASSGFPFTIVFRDFDPTGLTSPAQARMELWPHQKSQYVIPFLYVMRATDISTSVSLPYTIRGDVIVEGALRDVALWPGASKEQRNPYYNPVNANLHERTFERMVGELERQDDELFEQDVNYRAFSDSSPWAPYPVDARFLQSHILG